MACATASPLPLRADRDRLNQALANLLKNAIQASGPGGLVEVRAEGTLERVTIRVSDTGPGPEGGDFERLFEDFRTTRNEGTGLGLPMTRRIVEAHGGDLFASREDGRTVFRLELPG